MSYLNLFYLTLVVVFVVDISGVTDVLLRMVSAWTGRRFVSLRPFTCSLCMTWWCGLAACMVWRTCDLAHVAFVAGLAFLASVIADAMRLVKDSIVKIINRMNRWN